jgi:hypothetical protein
LFGQGVILAFPASWWQRGTIELERAAAPVPPQQTDLRRYGRDGDDLAAVELGMAMLERASMAASNISGTHSVPQVRRMPRSGGAATVPERDLRPPRSAAYRRAMG